MGGVAAPYSTPLATSSSGVYAFPALLSRATVGSRTAEAEERPLSVREAVEEYFADAPMLVAVARCESSFRHYDSEGSVLRGEVNQNDIGVMQINEQYHLKRAVRLGLNIYELPGNLAYARYLYEREGLAPWGYSSRCWKKAELALQ